VAGLAFRLRQHYLWLTLTFQDAFRQQWGTRRLPCASFDTALYIACAHAYTMLRTATAAYDPTCTGCMTFTHSSGALLVKVSGRTPAPAAWRCPRATLWRRRRRANDGYAAQHALRRTCFAPPRAHGTPLSKHYPHLPRISRTTPALLTHRCAWRRFSACNGGEWRRG